MKTILLLEGAVPSNVAVLEGTPLGVQLFGFA